MICPSILFHTDGKICFCCDLGACFPCMQKHTNRIIDLASMNVLFICFIVINASVERIY